MQNNKVIDIVLWILLAVGFIGGIKISYANFTGSPCPQLGFIPICYVVTVAYGLMILAVMLKSYALKHYLFCIGWGTAFVVALTGSVAEFAGGGGVCPTSGGGLRGEGGSIPLCYASLAICVVILVLFLMGPYKRACDACNAEEALAKANAG